MAFVVTGSCLFLFFFFFLCVENLWAHVYYLELLPTQWIQIHSCGISFNGPFLFGPTPPSFPLSLSLCVSEFERIQGSAWEPELWWRAYTLEAQLNLISTSIGHCENWDGRSKGWCVSHLFHLSRDYVIYKNLVCSNLMLKSNIPFH